MTTRRMKVVVAPDSFKESITAAEAAAAIADGWTAVDPSAEIVSRPMADGGEGTLEAFAAAVTGAEQMPVTVDGPAGIPVRTAWLLLPPTPDAPRGTGVIDLASTSGIELMTRLRPLDADTTGFGQAISAALDHGVSRLVLGIGSSASTDGGTGMLSALGARFLDEAGAPVALGARGLADIVEVDLSGLRAAPEALVLTDVTNPLVGPRGAAAVFGPQKGLTESADVEAVDAALGALARLLGSDPQQPGSGAAGGVGGALITWGATLAPGAQEVARLLDLPDVIAGADVVVTGEGSYDGQSGDGKVPSYVADIAAAAGARAVLVAGRIAADADTDLFAAVASLTDLAGSADSALAEPARHLRAAGAALARALVGDRRGVDASVERRALVVRGGWDGHDPVGTTERFIPVLREAGFGVEVVDDLAVYDDAEQLAAADLIVHCWSMGSLTADQEANLVAAVRAGTGFAGWHGGIIGTNVANSAYLRMVGGRFLHHPPGFHDYTVIIDPAPGQDGEITCGLENFTVHTEQYWILSDDHNTVLASTVFDPTPDSEWQEPVRMPVTWTRRWGAGRVFVCTLGHQVADFDVPETSAMISRGLLWAARSRGPAA